MRDSVDCPNLVWLWMDLPSTIDWLIHQLPACKLLCVRLVSRSVTSSVILGLVYWHLPSLLLRLSVRTLHMSLGRKCCLRCTRPLLSSCSKHMKLLVQGRKMRKTHQKDGFGVRSVESSEFGVPACWTGVHKSDALEVVQVCYLSECIPASDQPCSNARVPRRSLVKRKPKRSATPDPVAVPKRLFEFDDESIVLPKRRGIYVDDKLLKSLRRRKIRL